jgi:hypothetical protein
MSWAYLHDSVLEKGELSWEQGDTQLVLRYHAEGTSRIGRLTCHGTAKLLCPREFPWGPSRSVNEVREAREQELVRLEVEMQSGDVIVVLGSSISFG